MKRIITAIFLILVTATLFAQPAVDNLLRARALYEGKQFGRALDLLRNSPGTGIDYRYLLLQGDIELETADYNAALISYNNANQLMEASGELGIARVYATLNDSRASVSHLELHLRSEFKSQHRKLLLDRRLAAIGESEPWRQLWRRQWYNQLEEGVEEVEYLLSRDRADEAKEFASSFTGLYSERPEVDYIRGILELNLGDPSVAAKYLRSSLDKDEGVLKVWISYIDALALSANFAGAVTSADRAISLFPDQLPLYLARVENLRESGDREKAFEQVTSIIGIYSDNEEFLALGAKLAYETRNWSSALRYLSENIGNHPGNPDYYVSRGDVYLASRTWEFAIVDYSMALDLDPVNGDVYYNKAVALLEMAKVNDACHDLRMALKQGNKKAASLISKHCIE